MGSLLERLREAVGMQNKKPTKKQPDVKFAAGIDGRNAVGPKAGIAKTAVTGIKANKSKRQAEIDKIMESM